MELHIEAVTRRPECRETIVGLVIATGIPFKGGVVDVPIMLDICGKQF